MDPEIVAAYRNRIDPGQGKYACSGCGKRFPSLKALRAHKPRCPKEPGPEKINVSRRKKFPPREEVVIIRRG